MADVNNLSGSHLTAGFVINKEVFKAMDIETKRMHYKCGTDFVLLSSILTWPSYFYEKLHAENAPDTEGMFRVDLELNNKVSIWKGDITTLEIDAIVNAANNSLLGGGGVDGYIHEAAGEDLRNECQTLNGCDEGFSKLTYGYKLPAKHVIHTVGPQTVNDAVLSSSYRTALELAVDKNIKTIAFPCISTGAYGYPPTEAAHAALRTTRHFLEKNREKIPDLCIAEVVILIMKWIQIQE